MSGDRPTTNYDPAALKEKYREERDKRLRADRDAQFQDATGVFEHFADDPFIKEPLQRAPVSEQVDVLVVGGGFGGLISASKLVKAGVTDFRIVEQGGDFGGTWYWNRYPGIRCDIESYVYMPMLEEVGTIPSERYAKGAEIFGHCQAIGRHFDLYDRALFQTRVTRMDWSEEEARWIVGTDRGDRIEARHVMIGQGPLMKIKLPGIPGIQDFEGRIFHSSRWDYDYTGGDTEGGQTRLADKRVAVIGTGATSIQIVPKLAEHAERVYIFQRTPSTIAARNNGPTDVAWFKSQPKGWQKARMENFLTIISGLPHKEDVVGDGWTDFWTRFAKRMAEQAASGADRPPPEIMQEVDFEKMEELRAQVRELVKDPKTAEAAMPWYNYLCKRPLFSDNYLQSLNEENITLVDTEGRGVTGISAHAVHVGDDRYEVDCIILATGFDVGARAHEAGGYEVTGRNGVTLSAYWSDGVKSLHGTQVHGFPNFHIVGGTAQGTLAFNYTHVLEIQGEHAVDQIACDLAEGIDVSEVSEEEQAEWYALLKAKKVDKQKFYEECTPGFLNNEGNFRDKPTFVGSAYGGGPVEYTGIIAEWRQARKARR
ncbi:MAG: NAD(P)/FAD-dependent oxidoreductase [Alphaproteobacteria bacterium]